MEKDFLKIERLRKVYNAGTAGEVVALNDMSFALSQGEFVTVVGSNAAGKSTLFNALAGALTPDTGDIMLDGNSVLGIREDVRAKFFARVRQNPDDSVVPSLTLAENMTLAKLRGQGAGLTQGVKNVWKEEFVRVLTPLGLGLEKRLDEKISLLSGGQKQTVALVMATLVDPYVLLLDEHTAALDPHTSERVLALTNTLVQQKKITTLMITHNIHHALAYGTRLILLERGKVALDVSGEAKQKLTVLDVVERLEGKVGEFEEDLHVRS